MTPIYIPWPDSKGIRAATFDKNVSLSKLRAQFSDKKIVSLKQVHGNDVIIVEEPFADGTFKADALITRKNDIALTVHTADCLPIMAYSGEVIGACHGGWRGVAAGIIESFIAKMGTLGAKKEDIRVAIGPSIGVCHFEVGLDVATKIVPENEFPSKFKETLTRVHQNPEKVYVDLREVARFKLLKLGLLPQNVSVSPHCTFCEEEAYFSYRRDGAGTGRMETLIVKSQD